MKPGAYKVVFSETTPTEGHGLWEGLVASYSKMHELERAIVDRIKPMETEEC